MTGIDVEAVRTDLDEALGSWRADGLVPSGPGAHTSSSVAAALVRGGAPAGGPAPGGPDVLVMTKAPHASHPTAAAAVVARLLAFGARVVTVERPGRTGEELAAVLHPHGHVPGLAALYEGGVHGIGVRLGEGPTLDELRTHVLGEDDRPDRCRPGSIRRDALRPAGVFVRPGRPDSRANVVHVSDGLLRGLIECRAVLSHPADGTLLRRLRWVGLTGAEIEDIVLRDPLVAVHGVRRPLTAVTRGLGLDDCVTTVGALVPPTFGRVNGHASGMSLPTFVREATRLIEVGGDLHRFSPTEAPTPFRTRHVRHVTSLGSHEDKVGRDAIADGRVGFIAPAGGTGGRFAGHTSPEDDARRNKALYPQFAVGDHDGLSGLDVRLANARWWRHDDPLGERPARLPLAVMASDSNARAVDAWRDEQRRNGARDVETFRQYGVYRLTADGVAREGRPDRWCDHIARRPDGRPSVKPPGNLGALTSFVLSGRYDEWRADGTEFLVLANGDDAGFRLDPRVVGHMVRRDLDAVLLVVQTGYSGKVIDGPREWALRWDQSGRGFDQLRRTITVKQGTGPRWVARYPGGDLPVEALRPDAGGLVCTVGGVDPDRARIGVVERNWGAMSDDMLAQGCLFSSNQMYLRCAALDRLMTADGAADAVTRARALVDALPVFIERSSIPAGGDEDRQDVIQLLQPYTAVLRRLEATEPLLLDRHPLPDQRGTYAPLKHPGDERYAQHLLDVLHEHGDELRLA